MNTFTIERQTNECRVVLAGDFTAAVVDSLKTALKREMDDGATAVTFDLGQTSMLDSSGIGLLIATFNSLAGRKGRISVQQVSPEILQLLSSMRLAQRLNVTSRSTT